MRERTEPSTTGLTISRCEGLKASDRWTGPPAVDTSELKPWWYFTSPAGRSSGAVWSNSANRSLGILPRVLTSTFRRPRWAMRSEEHTSELQSQSNLVCRLLLEKKKKKQ